MKHTEICDCVECEAEVAKHFKKHITREQWKELDLNQVDKWFSDDKEKSDTYPSIGDMIEFLGDGLDMIEHFEYWNNGVVEHRSWIIGSYDFYENYFVKGYEKLELVDALWEAVKYKLNSI